MAGAWAREVAEGLVEVDDALRQRDRAEVAGSATAGAELVHVLRQAERQDRPGGECESVSSRGVLPGTRLKGRIGQMS